MSDSSNTNFGYKTVNSSDKPHLVRQVFDSVASRYDLMNDLMSLGLHRLWKQAAVSACGIAPGHYILDVAGGSGDLAKALARRVDNHGHVVLTDINANMLNIGRDKLINQGLTNNLSYAQMDAEAIAFEDNTFDCVTIGFGLRNVTDQERALQSMLRVLKPGGKLVILEFSKPAKDWLSKLYDCYSFKLLPKLGQWIAKDADSYRYLVESIRQHPDQNTLAQMMIQQGFTQVTYQNLTGGIVALHQGYKR